MLRNRPIRNKLMTVMLITSGVVLLLTFAAYFAYTYYTFRSETVDKLSIIAKVVASNCTAALAFDNAEDAQEALSALQAEPHILAAVLYDKNGNIFAEYFSPAASTVAPQTAPGWHGFRFGDNIVQGIQPVTEENAQLGLLLIQSDMAAMYEQFRLYLIIAVLVLAAAFLAAYVLSLKLQQDLSTPIIDLAATAKSISLKTDYSIRAKKYDNDEVGDLTDAFNHMLARIEQQNHEITTLNQDLENKVADRTRDLELAYKELEAFSYTVSHDLNAPLRQIDSYISMYTSKYEGTLDVAAVKTLDNVTRKTRRLRQLIDDLLAFSQLGRTELTRVRISMDQIVKDIVGEYRKTDHPATFEIAGLPPAYGDEATLRQVWENLISNAVKYSSQKPEPRVEISFRSQDNAVIYSVRDNGAGFDMKNYHKLFNPFQRLHNQSEFEGTGVGLAIVDRIITKHGGKVWGESKLNEGTVFYFSLPR